jgi:FixJ family two-component response regulator
VEVSDVQRVLVLEDDGDLRDILCELLQVVGVEQCVEAASLEQMERQRAQVLECTLAILDINLGASVPSGLDAYHWLRRNGFQGRIIFLTGHARSHPLVSEAYRLKDVKVLAKPVDTQVLLDLVESSAHGTRRA